eukprot:TRINITY_DN52698_c0_g1_i2.p1 TRINITY_DN52698_c0_g1~~TRINITY_DN52698_c0_g1_i2.p1  ORF type:complete len:630 (+),score=78.50 TRINITY_DN52698_c0_g1_i2:46-1935(+)
MMVHSRCEMKLLLHVLLVPIFCISAAKLSSRRSDICPHGLQNRYPAGMPLRIGMAETHGAKPLDPVFDANDMATLQQALGNDADWKIGRQWYLKIKFASESHEDRVFGFAGANGGFLAITAPKGQAAVVEVNDSVGQPADRVEFEYRGTPDVAAYIGRERRGADPTVASASDPTPISFNATGNESGYPLWSSGKVIMTEICLSPLTCDLFKCPEHSRLIAAGIKGYSERECCTRKVCKEEAVSCSPSTQYRQHDNYTSVVHPKLGYNRDTCCVPIVCTGQMCVNDTKWKDLEGWENTLGSTKAECCEALWCTNYQCSVPALMTKHDFERNGTHRKGSTDADCCEPITCDKYSCQALTDPPIYAHKFGAGTIMGKSRDVCCDMLYCANFSCPNDTKWHPKVDTNHFMFRGNTTDQCCEKTLCNSYTCSKDSLQKKANQDERQGSTDDECCEKKLCADWQCSDPTMWVAKPDEYSLMNTDRRGWSDEECCDKVFCLPQHCDPATQWKPKVYCADFVCDTDFNNTGQGTAWWRKVDTNHYRWQGSTNEECCWPKYCSQYDTIYPTRWKRKTDPSLKGSTDPECYEKLLCREYCCADHDKVHIPDVGFRQGSTDEECCIAKPDQIDQIDQIVE